MADYCLDVALIHYPVVNRNGEVICSAVTNLDLHDIARAGCTYGVGSYWVITPDAQQQNLAAKIIGHWTQGYGGTVNPDRAAALSRVRIREDLNTVIADFTDLHGRRPLLIATSAERRQKGISYRELRRALAGKTSVLLLFGTAWGLAPELMERVDATLPPIQGDAPFNHLSVRSAASIVLDRLVGDREPGSQTTVAGQGDMGYGR